MLTNNLKNQADLQKIFENNSENLEQTVGAKRSKRVESKRQKAQKTPAVTNRLSERRQTGKGIKYREDSSDPDFDELEYESSEYTCSRRDRACKSNKNDSKMDNKKRNPWKPHEDATLLKLIKQHGTRWSLLSKIMGGARTGKQIRDRYLNKLDPSILDGKEWTEQEDDLLVKYWKKLGNKWSEIAKFLKGRTESMVKNRYYSHIIKQQGKSKKAAARVEKVEEVVAEVSEIQSFPEINEQPADDAEAEYEWIQPARNSYAPFEETDELNLLPEVNLRVSTGKIEVEDEAVQNNNNVQNRMSIVYEKPKSDQMVFSNRSSDCFNMIERYEIDGLQRNNQATIENQFIELLHLENTAPQVNNAAEDNYASNAYEFHEQNFFGDFEYYNMLRPQQPLEADNDYFANQSVYSDSIFRRFGRRGSDDVSVSSPDTYNEPAACFDKLGGFGDFQDEELENFRNIKI